jgi:hypothetical protein
MLPTQHAGKNLEASEMSFHFPNDIWQTILISLSLLEHLHYIGLREISQVMG